MESTWNGFHLSLRFQFLQGQKSCQHYKTTFSIMLSDLLSCSSQKTITVKLEDMSHGKPCSNDSWEPSFSILPSLFHIIYRIWALAAWLSILNISEGEVLWYLSKSPQEVKIFLVCHHQFMFLGKKISEPLTKYIWIFSNLFKILWKLTNKKKSVITMCTTKKFWEVLVYTIFLFVQETVHNPQRSLL